MPTIFRDQNETKYMMITHTPIHSLGEFKIITSKQNKINAKKMKMKREVWKEVKRERESHITSLRTDTQRRRWRQRQQIKASRVAKVSAFLYKLHSFGHWAHLMKRLLHKTANTCIYYIPYHTLSSLALALFLFLPFESTTFGSP